MGKFAKTLEGIYLLTGCYSRFGDFCPLPEEGIVELDLGCGKGGFTVALARKYPERLILGADVMLGRLRKVRKKIVRAGLTNVCCLRVEARFLLGVCLPDRCLDRLHILCPDPWPKARHRAHRLLCSDFMMSVNRVLKEGGVFHFATDDLSYLETVKRLAAGSGLFEQIANENALADVASEEFRTEFERDWLAAGKAVPHLAFRALKPPFTGMH